MDETTNIVAKWYSDERSLTDMKEGNNNTLKEWERDVAINCFPNNAKILDIGCGMGREAFNLYDMGFNLTGVDISEKAIHEAKQLAIESKRNILFLNTNGKELPFEDNSFNVVIIWAQTLGIIYGKKNQISFLKECNRVLIHNGIISFSGHDREYLKATYPQYLDEKKFFPFADTEIYWEMFTVDEMIELAQKAGFTVLDCQRGNIYRVEDGTILHCECRK